MSEPSVRSDSVHDAEPTRKARSLPHWVVLLVILVTGGFTVWAMSMTRFKGPSVAWDQAHEVVDGVWGEQQDTSGTQPVAWGGPNGADPNAAKQVAGAAAIPTIIAGVRSIHADRGVCTNCHSVLAAQGGPIPTINSLSIMPHEYRGVCNNCHLLTIAGGTTAARTVAATTNRAAGPKEAEWQGLEVGPSAQAVVVQGVEGLSARRGVLANDVIGSINGIAISNMSDFVRVTQNGALPQGTLIVSRSGQRLAFELASNPQPVPIAPPPPPLPTSPPALGAAPSTPQAPPAQEAQF